MLTQQEIKNLFDYQDGIIYWKFSRSGIKNDGNGAGSLHNSGYKIVRVNGKGYAVHRLIWIMFNGNIPDGMLIDHIDRNKLNNNIKNLRLATYQENNRNNSSNGFTWEPERKVFRSAIKIDGKKKHIGRYETILDARAAYLQARQKYFGEFA